MSIKQLKKIRSQRVERIYRELQRAKSSFAEAELKLQQARVEFRDYGSWRVQQQAAMFDTLQGDSFSPNEIRGYNLKLESLKEKEEQLKDVIPAFEVQLEDVEKNLNKVREKLQHANKDMEKVDEFIKIRSQEDMLLEEKQEENVADELSCFKSSQS